MPVDPRRRDQAAAGHRPRDQRPRQPGPHQASCSPDEISGGTFTISNNGSAGSVLTMPIINQPQVGDPLHRRDRPQAGRRHRLPDGGEAIAIHSGRQPGDELGPPGLRRRLRRRLPRARSRRSSRPATGRPSCDARRVAGRCTSAGSGAVPLPRGARAAAGAVRPRRATHAPAAARAPARVHLGPRADLAPTCSCDPAAVGAELVRADRGGDVTYHGPGQLVGYPILIAAGKRRGGWPTPPRRAAVEQLLIDALAELGLPDAGRLPSYPGVWVDADGPTPAQDRRDRRAPHAGPHDARLRPQRRPPT